MSSVSLPIVPLLAAIDSVALATGNEYGTPLQAAATGRNDGIAAFLLKHGADPNLRQLPPPFSITLLTRLRPDDLREPALIRVVVNEDNPVLVKALLDRGADINYMRAHPFIAKSSLFIGIR